MKSYRVTYTTSGPNASTTSSVEWGDTYERLDMGDPKAHALRWAEHVATRPYVTSVEVVELAHTTIHEYRRK
jgi:hypothetical protein